MDNLRVGTGFDVHKFAENRKLVLGGVEIDFPLGLAGHSDADVLIHAVMDSLLGPSGFGDIGILFPDSDERYRGASSLSLMSEVRSLLYGKGVTVINIDAVIICEKPKIAPYIPDMKRNIAESLGIEETDCIGIKGTTTEGLGFTGRREGIAVYASSLISLK